MTALTQQVLLVALGGAGGAAARFLTVGAVSARWGSAFPFGTLSVNVLGALVIGVLYVQFGERHPGALAWRALLITGFLGGYTTFSAFSLETLRLLEAGEVLRALVYVLASVVLCLLGCWLGMLVARQF